MKLTFLGTGTSQGIPVIGSTHPVCRSEDPRDKRLRVSILIQNEGKNYVVDCGPDFREQMLEVGIDTMEALLFTHEHSDHTAGLDDIRPFYFMNGSKPIPVYLTQRVSDNLTRRFDYIFDPENDYPGVPNVNQYIIDTVPFQLDGMQVTPVQASHGSVPVIGYRFDYAGKSIAYMTDVKTIESQELKKLHNLDVLVLNALRETEHHSHLNKEQALELITQLKPKQAYLTHISHYFGFHKDIEASLPETVHCAYDSLEIDLN